MKAYKLDILIIDHDNVGADEIKSIIENVKYPNWCISPTVEAIHEAEIGEWTDDHPLNKQETASNEYQRLFGESDSPL